MICEKCGYKSEKNIKKNQVFLCEICFLFSPKNEKEFENYISEKIDSKQLESFRKYHILKKEKQKRSMSLKAEKGFLMSRAPFGYKIENGNLIPSSNKVEVEEIFEKFLNQDISLRSLSKKYNFSVNGIKKILTNFTYIGKIKFNNQIYQGEHEPIISSTLFNHVQNKLEKLKIK